MEPPNRHASRGTLECKYLEVGCQLSVILYFCVYLFCVINCHLDLNFHYNHRACLWYRSKIG